MECIERVNLNGAEHKYPGEISGGMQKRVAIARAVVMNPKYLFCDEPNSGLDPKTSLIIDELLSGITKDFNITTIINTHDMNSVMGIGENILFIADGRKEWQGNKDTVISSHNKKLNDLVFASDLFKKRKGSRNGRQIDIIANKAPSNGKTAKGQKTGQWIRKSRSFISNGRPYYYYLIIHKPFFLSIGTTICSVVLSPKCSSRNTLAVLSFSKNSAWLMDTESMPLCSSFCRTQNCSKFFNNCLR